MYLFGLLVIGTVVAAVKAEVDCNQRPPHVSFKDCCELSNVLSEDVKEKCLGQFGQPRDPPGHHGPRGGPHKHWPFNHCFLSCVVNETGILVDGELQEDNVMSYLNDLFEDSEEVEFLSSKFSFCNEKRKDFEKKWPKRKNGPPHCSSKANGMLIGCVHIHAFKDCPDSSWSNTDECNAVRDHFNQCWPTKDKFDMEEDEAEGI